MKKLFSFCLGVFFVVVFFSVSISDNILDYLDNIGNDLFGYKLDIDKLSIQNITKNSIIFQSPVLKDEFGAIIDHYVLMYSLYPLSEIIDDPSLISSSKEKVFSHLNLAGKTSFTMELMTTDGVDPSKTYYLVAVPKDLAGTLGEISNEMCFNLNANLTGEGAFCTSAYMHAAGADMSLANISHTINGSLLTLKWIAVQGSDYVDIFLWNESANNFDKITTVAMSKETYSFTLTRDGEHILKFIPNKGGKEINYTFNVIGVAKDVKPVPQKPTAVKPVVVGPKENIIAILIGTIVLYLAYKLVRRKS